MDKLNLELMEARRVMKLWDVREAQPRRESTDLFIENLKLQWENQEDFDEVIEKL